MSHVAKTILTAAVSLAALSACSVNTAPPAASPSPVVVAPPSPPATITTPGSTVVVPRSY